MPQTPTPEIRAFFDSWLKGALPTIGISEGQVAWFNVKFNPNVKQAYIEPFLILNPTLAVSLGQDGFEELNGIYQLNCYHMKDKGPGPIEHLSRSLVDVFRGGQRFDFSFFSLIISTAYSGNPVSEKDRAFTPVSVVWQAYVQK